MYPFERFTEDAKKSLTLAQEEAERSHHSYIGTEHLLLGLMRLQEGVAYEVLRDLGIEIEAVRDVIAQVLGRYERILIQQIIPTSRVKNVIELSFEEARRMGENFVDSGHLLMGLVIEGEGIAAHVLEDLGATREKVVAAVEKKHRVEQSVVRRKHPTPARFTETRTVARSKAVPDPESDSETLQRLLKIPAIEALMKRHGLDIELVYKQLGAPPLEVVKLRAQLTTARHNLADAVGHQDYELAARVQKQIAGLRPKLQNAEEAWLKTLGD